MGKFARCPRGVVWRRAGRAGLLLGGVLLAGALFGACGTGTGPEPAPSPTPEMIETPTPPSTPPPSPTPTPNPYEGLEGINPLTGLPMEADYEDRRPAAVMLNNLKKALPMFGVSQADIIYEALAEGGITRMVGVFQNPSQVPQIGTVRSTRAYYLDIAQGHDAILLHAGGSPEAYTEIKRRGVAALDCLRGYEGSLYWRDKDRIKNAGLEHSAFTSGARIESVFQTLKVRIRHEEGYREALRFADDGTPAPGAPAVSISVRYSSYKTGLFTYDPETKRYACTQYDAPYIDGQDETQVSVVNVLVLRAAVSQVKGDSAGRLTTRLTGTGEGFFACGGRMTSIVWSKASHDAPFVYTLKDGGAPLVLGRGQSYINIVSTKASVEVS
ncbi:MAG: DUF3048 domain-containing protein [Oscillospiraceae bacterium]|nr:DUF3048 domain-containing protein [Oscillospiraceae bacterium]